MEKVVILFAKIPTKGATKTRLVSSYCSEDMVFELCRAMLKDTLRNLLDYVEIANFVFS